MEQWIEIDKLLLFITCVCENNRRNGCAYKHNGFETKYKVLSKHCYTKARQICLQITNFFQLHIILNLFS